MYFFCCFLDIWFRESAQLSLASIRLTVSILSAAKEMDCPIIPIISLTLSTIVFGTLYYDAVPHSPGVQIALLAFSIATAFGYWIHANLTCCPDGLLTKGDV
jgi:hypothetical protein